MSSRPAVIEIVSTTGPRRGGRRGDTQTYFHARLRAAGNRRVTWWSEDYNRPGKARHAVELLPGFQEWVGDSVATFGAGLILTPVPVRTVDERRSRR